MTRSIGGKHRMVRLAAVSAALVSMGLLSACSAGQLAETSEIKPAVPGGSATWAPDPANAPDQLVLVQNATVVYGDTQGYPMGASAPLSMTIINQTENPITIAPVGAALQSTIANGPSTKAGTLAWQRKGAAADGTTPSQAPSAGTPSAPVSPSAPASPDASASASAPAAPAADTAPLTIPPAESVVLSPSQERYLTVANVTGNGLAPGSVLTVTLNVVDGSQTHQLSVPTTFAPPSVAPARQTASPAPGSSAAS